MAKDFADLETYEEMQAYAMQIGGGDEAKKQIKTRQRTIARLSPCVGLPISDGRSRLCPRDDVYFSTAQGRVLNARKKRYTFGVEMFGRGIGSLRVNLQSEKPTERYIFVAKDSASGWEWSKNRAHAKEINAYLKKQREKSAKDTPNVQEREVQWRLANALGRDPELKGLKAVRWFGWPTEIGVSINREGRPATGNIDILVRRRERNIAQFLVCELKGPNDGDVANALRQAICYAVALHHEANASNETRESYRTVFGSKDGSNLQVGVFVAVHRKFENDAKVAVEALQFGKSATGLIVDRIGVLLYDLKGRKATDWRWLAGWDPRLVGVTEGG